MAVSAADVKKLRETTGAPMLDCKNALEQHGGDVEKAVEWLKEKGLAKAAKKAERAATEGRVEVYVHLGNRVAVMAEINCETDFVAKTEAFQTFAHEVALHIAMANPKYLDVADIPPAEVEAAQAGFRDQAVADGKPAAIADKVAEGRMEKFYQEMCLLRQPFVKDEEKTIRQLLTDAIAAIGENIVIRRFIRYELGNQ
ncbi:MAG: translation elongation factor Ts [Chloroflexi bacterium]|nr:translation elongation factor Ts [Chloroflexota bacterium]MBI2976302.1 translation elongation factor Ts [Chloroflexota bacterium]MBI3176594.1 translation elongation factor Ts [Chloroflexota bacterium]MBI5292164.1 translation elongation factor Ts [Chloroflexota bacterium]